MNILWLLVSGTPPAACYPDVICLWCPPSSIPGRVNREKVFVSPGKPMAPLCRAFYALSAHSHDGPVMISTDPLLPQALLPGQQLSNMPLSELTGPDEGALYWPTTADFIRHAGNAICEHDPASGPILLEAAWHQVLLDTGVAQ